MLPAPHMRGWHLCFCGKECACVDSTSALVEKNAHAWTAPLLWWKRMHMRGRHQCFGGKECPCLDGTSASVGKNAHLRMASAWWKGMCMRACACRWRNVAAVRACGCARVRSLSQSRCATALHSQASPAYQMHQTKEQGSFYHPKNDALHCPTMHQVIACLRARHAHGRECVHARAMQVHLAAPHLAQLRLCQLGAHVVELLQRRIAFLRGGCRSSADGLHVRVQACLRRRGGRPSST